MLGMEKMIASMLGMESEELTAKVKEIETVFLTISSAMNALAENQIVISNKIDKLQALLEGFEFERVDDGQ